MTPWVAIALCCSHVPAALELLCDCVINPAFRQEELDEQKFRLQLLLSSPEVQLTLLTEVCLQYKYLHDTCMQQAIGSTEQHLRIRSSGCSCCSQALKCS